METNKVELSGEIAEIRTSERGTNFVMIKQIVNFGGVERTRLFETLINAERKDLIDQIAVGKKVRVFGSLTIFKVKKFNIHKMLVEVDKIEPIE
ncbi:MAG: hypothetical protein LBS76_03905 [Mycoplasmataceae bacterium]|jgi:exonuclease VII large subunit|nr:hypothetical protein [Mycoplasmataceae bacterium]